MRPLISKLRLVSLLVLTTCQVVFCQDYSVLHRDNDAIVTIRSCDDKVPFICNQGTMHGSRSISKVHRSLSSNMTIVVAYKSAIKCDGFHNENLLFLDRDTKSAINCKRTKTTITYPVFTINGCALNTTVPVSDMVTCGAPNVSIGTGDNLYFSDPGVYSYGEPFVTTNYASGLGFPVLHDFDYLKANNCVAYLCGIQFNHLSLRDPIYFTKTGGSVTTAYTVVTDDQRITTCTIGVGTQPSPADRFRLYTYIHTDLVDYNKSSQYVGSTLEWYSVTNAFLKVCPAIPDSLSESEQGINVNLHTYDKPLSTGQSYDCFIIATNVDSYVHQNYDLLSKYGVDFPYCPGPPCGFVVNGSSSGMSSRIYTTPVEMPSTSSDSTVLYTSTKVCLDLMRYPPYASSPFVVLTGDSMLFAPYGEFVKGGSWVQPSVGVTISCYESVGVGVVCMKPSEHTANTGYVISVSIWFPPANELPVDVISVPRQSPCFGPPSAGYTTSAPEPTTTLPSTVVTQPPNTTNGAVVTTVITNKPSTTTVVTTAVTTQSTAATTSTVKLGTTDVYYNYTQPPPNGASAPTLSIVVMMVQMMVVIFVTTVMFHQYHLIQKLVNIQLDCQANDNAHTN